ncbi:MAG TPA: sigma-70 region 4 domain-containing protein [Solirubrobacteraceae bacterium]|nr:sigma-70 region 4 domain-containing protein [Solirubrobacteraceae bacterium]
MARIDDLPADQQAVLRLLLAQDRSYDEIARSLRMAPAAVRDRAHEAVASLGPADTTLSRTRRAEISDYLLGQQDAAHAADTRQYLAEVPAAKAWARVVAGELGQMASSPLPDIPDGAASPSAETAQGADERRELFSDDTPAPAARATRREAAGGRRSSRAGGAILLTAVGLLAALAIGFFVGRATKSSGTSSKPAATTAAATTVLGQANLTPPAGSPAPKALGIAQFVTRDGQKLINVIAQGLPTAPKGSGYGIWLTAAGQQPVWLGYFQAVSSTGQVGAQSRLTVDPAKYRTVLLTRQTGRKPTTPAQAYLSGTVVLKK